MLLSQEVVLLSIVVSGDTVPSKNYKSRIGPRLPNNGYIYGMDLLSNYTKASIEEGNFEAYKKINYEAWKPVKDGQPNHSNCTGSDSSPGKLLQWSLRLQQTKQVDRVWVGIWPAKSVWTADVFSLQFGEYKIFQSCKIHLQVSK